MKMHMNVLGVFVVLVMIFGVQRVVARPNNIRVKRVSDPHLADLETKIALNSKVKGYAITIPIGGGRLDLERIGRKRRSQSRFLDVLFNQSDEDNGEALPLLPMDFDQFLYKYRLNRQLNQRLNQQLYQSLNSK